LISTLLHVPFNFLPVHRSKKVVTIHDVGFLRFPNTYAPSKRMRMTGSHGSRALADHVLTGSLPRRAEITAAYGISDDRVTVLPTRGSKPVPTVQTQRDGSVPRAQRAAFAGRA